MQSTHAIEGAGWSVSFQRRVGAANRGALPIATLESSPDRVRVAVPLRTGEALWVAVIAAPSAAISVRMGTATLDGATTSAGKDTMHRFDAEALGVADARRDVAADSLTITLETPDGTVRIGAIAVTPQLYEELSGEPAPRPTTEDDQYGGWRLP